MDLNLTGRNALVTGSTSGIGAGIAIALAREGATVVVHGRSEARAKSVVEQIVEAGGKAHYALGDLGNDDGANAVIEQALGAVKKIDILVNNVGGPVEGKVSFFDTTLGEWADSYNGNALAAVRMIQGLVPAMKARGWGRVIQITSRNAISPHANMPSYGGAKAAMNNFTLGLSKELAFTGVTSNASCLASSIRSNWITSCGILRSTKGGARILKGRRNTYSRIWCGRPSNDWARSTILPTTYATLPVHSAIS